MILTETNHVFNYQKEFLFFLGGLTYELNGENKPKEIEFEVHHEDTMDSNRTVMMHIDETFWIKYDELKAWINTFKNIKVGDIDTMTFGYINGITHPMMNNPDQNKGYYIVSVKLTYK